MVSGPHSQTLECYLKSASGNTSMLFPSSSKHTTWPWPCFQPRRSINHNGKRRNRWIETETDHITYTASAISWPLLWALSFLRLETALTAWQLFTSHPDISITDDRFRCYIYWKCTVTANDKNGCWQMKFWQERYIISFKLRSSTCRDYDIRQSRGGTVKPYEV